MHATGLRRTAVLVVLVVVFGEVTGGVARSYWAATGVGSAGGSTGVSAPLTLSPGSVVADLYPGGRGDVKVIVTNSNPQPVLIASLVLDTSQGGGFGVDAEHSGCSVSALSFITATTGWTVPARAGARNGSLSLTLPTALAMSLGAANSCQGAVFSIYLRAVQ